MSTTIQTDSNSIIELKNVHRTYSLGKTEVHAVRGIDLKVEKSKFVSFMGRSGCGKTTTLNIVGCIDAPTHGEVIIHGANVYNMSDNALTEFRGKTIGFIFQNFNLIPVLNVFENIAYPLQLMNVPRAEINERVQGIIEYIGIADWAKHRPNELSGGQRQRTAIARALVIDPTIVIADEPTANLDSKTSAKIMELMQELQQRLHTTFVFATHEQSYMEYVDTVFEMRDGVIIDRKDLR